jgi:trimeric autotransporter adhesin
LSFDANTTGRNNAAFGYFALSANTTADNNAAFGVNSLYANSTGTSNTAVGMSALQNNTTASSNTAVGYQAGYANTTGANLVAVGENAASANTTGTNNIAIGVASSVTNTTGQRNVAMGTSSGRLNITGDSNTCIGHEAGYYVTGSGNVIIGSWGTATYIPAANISSESNRVVMSSTAVTNAYIQVAWTVVSDARDKINFAPVPHGLDFVTKLNPIQYQFTENRGDTTPHGPVRYGFKAQEILALEGETPVIIDAEDSEKLRYNGESLVPVLVKALQELSAKNDALEARLAALES